MNKKNECFDIVDRLDELLKPLKEYVSEIEYDDRLTHDAKSFISTLANGEFIVHEYFDGTAHIDWAN